MTLLNFFEGRSRNRRVNLYVVQDEDGFIFFHVITRLLVGGRQINKTNNKYSYETFRAIYEMMDVMFSNSSFKELTAGYLDGMKNDVMKVNTNIETK